MKREKKWTPGPWQHWKGNTYFQKTGNLMTADLVVDPSQEWVAAVWQDITGGLETQEANGRLIAAAPELVEALEKLMPSHCQKYIYYEDAEECGTCGYCLGRAVLARVYGAE